MYLADNDYEYIYGYDDFGVSFLKKITKVLRKPVAAIVGIATAGLIPPKLLGIKSAKSKKIFRKGGIAGKIVGGVVAAVFLGPPLLAMLSGTGAAAGATTAAGAKGPLSFITNFLKKNKGLGTAALGIAQSMIAGKEPIPSDLDDALSAEFRNYKNQKGKTRVSTKLIGEKIFGLTPTTLALIGVGGIAIYMLSTKQQQPMVITTQKGG